MTREEAIEVARRHAKLHPERYYAEPFQPHEWVIRAIIAAARDGYQRGWRDGATSTGDDR